jgi:hypothetical protein
VKSSLLQLKTLLPTMGKVRIASVDNYTGLVHGHEQPSAA